MYSTISTRSKQVLVWALMFVLVLSAFPTTIADESDDEWFYDIEESVTDEDGDGNDDTIEIGYDPDTECNCDINITVYVDIYDEDGYVGYIYDYHTINNGEYDWFSQEWTAEYSGTFDFYVEMYDEWGNFEDSWNTTDIELEPMSGSSDETINVGNWVHDSDYDDIYNDIEFRANIKDDGVEDVEVNVEYFNGVIWTYYTNGTTDEDGIFMVKNATTGEYRYTAEYDDEDLEEETVSYTEVDTVNNLSHDMILLDLDDAGDYDDIGAILFEDDDTSDEGYVEIYDDNGDLYDSGNTDTDWYGYTIYALYDVEKGNYTYDFYYEEDGELLQSGWLHSYGSTSTNYDEWFEDWDYETNDTNGDGEANSIVVKYDPNTECNCTVEIEVDFSVYNNDTGDWEDSDYYNHEINGTEVDSFETDEWSPDTNGNFTFEFYLYDENLNYEDSFNFTVYLECDDENDDCDEDEWFEDWDYDTESTDDDNLDDTINIDYNPDTSCDCDVGVYVYMDVYENASGDWVDYTDSQYHEINGTEEEYFTHSWTSANSTSYDFYVYMYDDNYNFEDSFWVYNVYLYQKSGAGGPGDDDEYFDWIYEYVYDNDDDGYNDTVELDYDPDTTCECNINVTLYIDVYDNETGAWVNGSEEDYTIYSDDDDYWYQYWSPEYNGTFDFYVELYDEDENLEDEREYLGVELHARSSGGGGGDEDYDEYFYEWDYDVEPSDKITIGYDPDTECDCEMEINVYVDVYESDSGDWIDYVYANHTIYNGYSDWFTQDWTSSNDGYYDFNVSMYDEDWNYEDQFWIYDVYLSSDDGGGGNGTGDDNDVGHVGVIDDWDEDDYVNDYIGYVIEDDEFKEDAYFEVYDEDWSLVDSGNPNYYDFLFVSYNLTEGIYYGFVYYEEGDSDYLQASEFYSYGNSTVFDIVNVDNAVIDEDEYAVYDDVGFIAHKGSIDDDTGTRVEGVEIDIYKYDETSGDWDYHTSLVTDVNGEAWIYNETCGEYEWHSSESTGEVDGYYNVLTCGDDTGSGGGDEDYDEWFYDWDYYGTYDENDEHQWENVIIAYDPDTDCDCAVDVDVYIDVFDNATGDYLGYISDNHTIYGENGDHFEQKWTADYAGKYDFYVELYDQEYGHSEDSFEFSLIMSDEWFFEEFNQDGSTVRVNLDPQTEYDGEIGTYYYFEVFRLNESNDWEYVDGDSADAVITSSDNENLRFEWTAEEDGTYRFEVYMYDEYWNMEDMADFETDIVLNHAPEIGELNTDRVFEGQMFNFEVDAFDADGDDLEYMWEMGDESSKKDGDSVRHGYSDDGVYIIVVSVSDGETTTTKEFELIVENMDPTVNVMYDEVIDEGTEVSFAAQTDDVAADEVKIMWSFPDGSMMEGNFAQYTFRDDGEYLVTVIAEDEDGGVTQEMLMVIVNNVAPQFTQFEIPSGGEEGTAIDFQVSATDPGDDTIVYTFDFGDDTAVLMSQDGNMSHKFAEGDTFTVIICAKDEDGGETCRTETIPVSVLEELEDEGLLPGFSLISVISALGVIGILRRRTH